MSVERPVKRNWRRRVTCAVVCILPFALAIGSIIFGAIRGPVMYPYGLYVVLFAALIGGLNFWLSWVRPLIHRNIHGSAEGFHFVSGIPVIGTLAATVGLLLSFGHVATALLGLSVLFLDTGGFPYFVAMTWRDRWLWDEAPLH